MSRLPQLAVMIVAALSVAGCWGEKSAAREDPTAAAESGMFPALTGRVVDQAKLLDADQIIDLSAKSAALEQSTGHQFVIATVTSLHGMDEATYTRKLGNQWRIGRKDVNDGVIFMVAPHERAVRIAVGDGLRKALTDAECRKILKRKILPSFRKGDMAGGITNGADAIIGELSAPSEPS